MSQKTIDKKQNDNLPCVIVRDTSGTTKEHLKVKGVNWAVIYKIYYEGK